MSKNEDQGGERMTKSSTAHRRESTRFMQELDLLRLEGLLFCFDPKEAKHRQGKLTLKDARKRELTIEIHPNYGQPTKLAYKVEQAALHKITTQGCTLTEDGRCLFSHEVLFGCRELARLTGRTWGTAASEQLYEAVMQLRVTLVNEPISTESEKGWRFANFNVFSDAEFSGSGDTLSRVLVRVHPRIIENLNQWHVAFFNLERLRTLEPIGIALYKNVCFNLSKLMTVRKGRPELTYCKDYHTICREWLGGLKPKRYKADIELRQLGRHLKGLQATGLIKAYRIEPNAKGTGFNIIFSAGTAFFEDYEAYYRKQPKPQTIARTAELEEVSALNLVAHFHRMLGHTHHRFQDHEIEYVTELLRTYGEPDIRDLIAYAIAEAPKTKYDMLYIGALKGFVEPWSADRKRRQHRERQSTTIMGCRLCNDAGMLQLRRLGTGEFFVTPCPHHPEHVAQIEASQNATRV
jgi:hypothetical protein